MAYKNDSLKSKPSNFTSIKPTVNMKCFNFLSKKRMLLYSLKALIYTLGIMISIQKLHTNYSYVHIKPLQSMFMKRNEVTLTGQIPLLKCCYSLGIFTKIKKELDLLMLKI